MKNANTITTLEALRKKEGDLLFDIRANLEGIAALALSLHTVSDPEWDDKPLLNAQKIACAVFGLQKAVENLDTFVGEGESELFKAWNAITADER